jgi:hypothetical protein
LWRGENARNPGGKPNRIAESILGVHGHLFTINAIISYNTNYNFCQAHQPSSCRNGNFDLNPSLDVDNDLLHDFRRSIQTIFVSISIVLKACHILNQALVDPHFEEIPRLRTFPAWRLPRADSQVLGRQTHRALDSEVLALRAVDEFGADFLCGVISIGGAQQVYDVPIAFTSR